MRKHSRWLWAVIIVVIIVSFVVFFSPDANLQGGGGENFGTVYGESVRRSQLVQAYSDARLGYFFSSGSWPGGRDDRSRMFGFNLDSEARQRLALNFKARQLGIKVSDAAVAQEIRTRFTDRETGVFSVQRYDAMLKGPLASQGITERAFEEFIAHELALQQVAQLFGLSGKLMPVRAAEAFFRREHEQVLTAFVYLANSNSLAKVVAGTNAIHQYFTNNARVYSIPERVQVTYVHFVHTNFLIEADKQMAADTNLNARLEQEYQKRGTNTFRDAESRVLPADAALAKLRGELRDQLSALAGRKAGTEFAKELFMLPNTAASLLDLATKKGLKLYESEPFSELEGPKGLDVPADFSNMAFGLSEEEPLGNLLSGRGGTFLIAFKQRLKSEIPPFETVREKVTADYRRSQSSELTLQEGSKFAQAINDGLAKGKAFADLCREAGRTAEEVPKFNRGARRLEPLDKYTLVAEEYRDLAFSLSAGQASTFRPSSEGGYILFVKALEPVAEERLKLELPGFAESLRENRANYAFQEWYRREMDRSGVLAQVQAASEKSPAAQ